MNKPSQKSIFSGNIRILYPMLTLMFCLCLTSVTAQESKVKVGEFNFKEYEKIEDRVFFVNELQENGYTLEVGSKDNTIDVFVGTESQRAATDNDIDDYFSVVEQIKQDWQPFSALERKSERVVYYIMNRQNLDSEVLEKISAEYSSGRPTENATCETALPFCSDNGEYHFYPGVNSGSACGSTTTASCSQPYDNCGHEFEHHGWTYDGIYTAPNPAFYFMRIGQPGDVVIHMEGHTTSGGNLDIDFVCWGPFDNMEDMCNLSCDNMADASYSAQNTEDCYINNAQTGQFYMLLITNYGNNNGEFFFVNNGTGSTDCGIMEPSLESNAPLCYGGTLQLSANDFSGADSFLWEAPDGWTSTEQNPYRTNVNSSMSGIYTCTITKDGETAVSEIEINIYELPLADFEMSAEQVCVGTEVTFTGSYTTYPEGGTPASFLWRFGDGMTDTNINTTYAYSESGTYTVRFSVIMGDGACEDVVNKTIIVSDESTPIDQYVTSCYSFSWYGQVYTQSGDYEHLIQSETGCDSLMYLHLTMTDLINTEFDAQSCDNYVWNGIVYANSGDFVQTFTSTYNCDSIVTMHLSIVESVGHDTYVEECPGYIWDGTTYAISGDFKKVYTAANGCDSIVTMHFIAKDTPYTEFFVDACDSYTWDGIEYTSSGIYPHVYDAANECDSTAVLRLTMFHSPDAYISGDLWVATNIQDSTILTAWGGTSYLWNTGDTTQSIVVNPGIETLYYCIVTNEDGCSSVAEATVINATGVDENIVTLNIYPNPTNGTINIEADAINTIRLCDILGQVLLEKNISNNNTKIDISNLPNGQYILQVQTTNGTATRRVIKL